jgi:heat shock protein HslJ
LKRHYRSRSASDRDGRALNGIQISIEITHTTRAACPPGSLEQRYIRDLNAAAVYFMEGDVLYIDLKYDTGTMKFTR